MHAQRCFYHLSLVSAGRAKARPANLHCWSLTLILTHFFTISIVCVQVLPVPSVMERGLPNVVEWYMDDKSSLEYLYVSVCSNRCFESTYLL